MKLNIAIKTISQMKINCNEKKIKFKRKVVQKMYTLTLNQF